MTKSEMNAALDLVERWVDPLGLMPDDEASMHLAIHEALTVAHERGRQAGLAEVLEIFAKDEDGDYDFILHQIRSLIKDKEP